MRTDVLIIGSSAAGLAAAATGKKLYPNKDFLIITKQAKTLVTCAIPYVFGELGSTDNNTIPMSRVMDAIKANIIHSEAVSVNRAEKSVEILNGDKIYYDRLVMATGSTSVRPTLLKGHTLDNVFYVPKDKPYLDMMQQKLQNLQNVVVVGAGFIGVEMAEQLQKAGKKVTLIEKGANPLHIAFDDNITNIVNELLVKEGVNVQTSTEVSEVSGNRRVERVLLNNGEVLKADAVILTLGYVPNSDIAVKAGLPVNSRGAIQVDQYMRTADHNIFAIGDCAEKRNFFTRKESHSMLSSTASSEGRIAGMNLFKLSSIKFNNGIISIFSTSISGMGFGVAGFTEKTARKEGFNIVTGEYRGRDKHPHNLQGISVQYVKLIVNVETGLIIGGAVYGGQSAGELINMIGVIIQSRMNISSVLALQIGSHPLLTDSPATYPVIKAAENALFND